MVIIKEESGISTNYMVLPRLHFKMVALIGGNTRMVARKDMEHKSGMMEADTLGNTCMVSNTGMECTDGQMERYIKGNGNKIKKMVMHISGVQVAMSIMDSGRMIICTERGSCKRKAYYTESNIK
jgi:hypothetical protein